MNKKRLVLAGVIGLALAAAGGLVATSSASAATGSELSIARSSPTVTYGDKEVLYGRLTTISGTGIEGAVVGLYGRRTGSSVWGLVDRTETGRGGSIVMAHRPGVNSEYRFGFAGIDAATGSVSAVAGVAVRPKILTDLSPRSTLVRQASLVHGKVWPADGGKAIWLEQYYAGAWHGVSVHRLAADGGFDFRVSRPASGYTDYRVVRPADYDNLAAASGKRTLATYSAVIAGIHYDAYGDDNRNLSDEYAAIKNTGQVAIDLHDWKLNAGQRGQEWKLPHYVLKAGATVNVHTGGYNDGRRFAPAGASPQCEVHGRDIYLDANDEVWANNGDTGWLWDDEGHLASKYAY